MSDHGSQALEFIARAAHDLRNQIAVVGAASSLLQRSWDALSDDLRREQVDVIAEYTTKLRELTDAVLDWATIETGKVTLMVEQVDVVDLVDAAIRQAAPGEPVELQLGAGGRVTADRVQLGRVLANLLSNAVKYGRPPFRVCAAEHGSEIVLRVQDYGDGVPQEIGQRIFEPFVRATDTKQGTGLGLAIVKGLVEMQGGRVWYEREGRVSSFAVALPSV